MITQQTIYDAVTFRPQTGLDIALKLEKQYDCKCHISDLYPILRQLENQGLIRSYWEIENVQTDDFNQERGGARRRYYVRKTGSASPDPTLMMESGILPAT